jgi:transcriptional regulator with XRE-family HTH domain
MAGLVGRTSPMPKTLHSPRHEALVAFLIDQRKRANVTQAELASKLGQYQSFVARAESGQRRIDVIEFLDWAEALGFDPKAIIKRLTSIELK